MGQSAHEALLGRRLNSSQIQRAAEVGFCLDLLVLERGSRSVGGLMALMQNTELTPERRSGIALLVLGGKYPLPEDFDSVRQGLALGNPAGALALAYSLTTRSSSKARILQVDRGIVEVTRYSAARRISGIPRVVKNLAFSPSFSDTALVVWENGVPGLGSRRPRGMVGFSKEHWVRPHERSGVLVLLYMRVARVLLANLFGARLLKFIDLYIRPLLRNFKDQARVPKYCVFLTDQQLYVPEVTSEEISQRLVVWKQVFPEIRISVIVHDMLPLTHPQYFPANVNREHLYYTRLLAVANQLFVATEALKTEVTARLASSFDGPPLVSVLPLPVSISEISTEHVGPDRSNPYFLFFGGFERRKALSDLVRYMEFVAPVSAPFRIVVLGAPWPGQGAEIWQTAERALVSGSVFEIVGAVDDRTLSSLISGASGILYLSHAEGYGLPVLEALSMGKLVITQDTQTNLEMSAIYGGVWPHFRFDDRNGFEAMARVVETADPFEALSVRTPEFSALPTDVDVWATHIRQSILER